MSKTGLGPRRLERCHSAAGSKGHPCDRSSTLRSIVRFMGKYLSKLNSEINKTQCSGPRHLGGKEHIMQSPGENSGRSPSSQDAFSHPSVTFNLTPWSTRYRNPCATDTFLFSLHEIHLVPSVFPFPPLYLQEHPILCRSLLTALIKYTSWDLAEQAVLFQTTSEAARSKPLSWHKAQRGTSWLTACGHFRSQDSPVHHCVPRAEVPNLAAH